MDKTELQHIYNVKRILIPNIFISFHSVVLHILMHVSTGNPGYVIVPQYSSSKKIVFVQGKNTLYEPKICRKH